MSNSLHQSAPFCKKKSSRFPFCGLFFHSKNYVTNNVFVVERSISGDSQHVRGRRIVLLVEPLAEVGLYEVVDAQRVVVVDMVVVPGGRGGGGFDHDGPFVVQPGLGVCGAVGRVGRFGVLVEAVVCVRGFGRGRFHASGAAQVVFALWLSGVVAVQITNALLFPPANSR